MKKRAIVHRADSRHPMLHPVVRCGLRHAYATNIDTWSGVTCKRCRATKRRPSTPPPVVPPTSPGEEAEEAFARNGKTANHPTNPSTASTD